MDDMQYVITPDDPTAHIIDDILAERDRQMQVTGWTWTGDAKNTINDWAAVIAQYATSVTHYSIDGSTEEGRQTQYDGLVKAGALVLAALQSMKMNDGFPPRHYDRVKE